MVSILLPDGSIYRFWSQFAADEWIMENEKYYSRDDLVVFVNTPPADSIGIEGTFNLKQCKNCGEYIRFHLEDNETALLECQGCHCRVVVQ